MTAVLAGIYSLIGSYLAVGTLSSGASHVELIVIASVVLVAAAITAYILSWYKAKKTGQKFFSKII